MACRRDGGSARNICNPAGPARDRRRGAWGGPADVTAALATASDAWRDWTALRSPPAARLPRPRRRPDRGRSRPSGGAADPRRPARRSPPPIAEVRESGGPAALLRGDRPNPLAPAEILPGPTGETNQLAFGARGIFAWHLALEFSAGDLHRTGRGGFGRRQFGDRQAGRARLPLIRRPRRRSSGTRRGCRAGALAYLPGDGGAWAAPWWPIRAWPAVFFTGSTATARAINQVLAARDGADRDPDPETGGINAMIGRFLGPARAGRQTDNSWSAPRQRRPALFGLRCLYVQEEIADALRRHCWPGASTSCGSATRRFLGDRTSAR